MTDPASLTFGISSLLGTIATTSLAVVSFVNTCRKARSDLFGVNQELSTLKQILEWLKNDTEGTHPASIPDNLTAQIVSIISHCEGTLEKIKTVLQRHSNSLGPTRWAIDGKKEVSSLQPELAAYSSALNLTLVIIDIVLTRDIKTVITAIGDGTADLKLGQQQILESIEGLRAEHHSAPKRDPEIGLEIDEKEQILAKLEEVHTHQDSDLRKQGILDPILHDKEHIVAKIEELQAQLPMGVRENNPILEMFLESLTSYAGSVCDEPIIWDDENDEEGLGEPRQQAEKTDSPKGDKNRSFIKARNTRNGSKYSSVFDQQTPSTTTLPTNLAPSRSSLRRDESSALPLPIYSSSSTAPNDSQTKPSNDSNWLGQEQILASPSLNEDDPRTPNPIQRVTTDLSQTTNDSYESLPALNKRGNSLSSFSDTTISLQSVTIADSRYSGSSRMKPRSTIPLLSGNWTLGQSIDPCKSGTIRVVKNKAAKIKAACKIISRPRSEESSSAPEVGISSNANWIFLLDHEHICRQIDILQTNNHWYLIMEYVSGGSLQQYLSQHNKLKEKQAKKFSRQIVSALEYCHNHQIIHRDLRPENILLTSKENVKLKGFVRNNIFSPNGDLLVTCRYPYYSAPEVLKAEATAGPAVDLWSFGAILYHMTCGTVPFNAEDSLRLVAKIINEEVTVEYNDSVTNECKELISRVLVSNPWHRATLKEVINHPWVTRGFDTAPSESAPARETLKLPLQDEVIEIMTHFNNLSCEAIRDRLTQLINSEIYQRATIQQRQKGVLSEQQPARESSMKRIFNLHRKQKAGTDTELDGLPTSSIEKSPQNSALNSMDPLVSLYYLARDKYQKEQRQT